MGSPLSLEENRTPSTALCVQRCSLRRGSQFPLLIHFRTQMGWFSMLNLFDFSMLTSSCHPLSMFHNRKSQGLASFLSDTEICCSEPTPGLLCRHCHRREKYWGTCFNTTNQFSLTLIFVSGSLFSSRSSKLENNSSSVAILILPS